MVLVGEEVEVDTSDDFDKIYKGEISKSGAAILPSKRTRKMPDKVINRSKVEKEKIKEEVDQTEAKAENEASTSENKVE